ncbi:uncharacterized protein [Cardiocondyla obscurior]|uniref:uncharacterized protein n=1 Tax=Cardiocondyla obscurior TaxID=286306 RepID=UPI0039655BEB
MAFVRQRFWPIGLKSMAKKILNLKRPGRPSLIYSDNGTNFVGAKRNIKELYEAIQSHDIQRGITSYLHDSKIEWSFIPPNAPHFGGLWESAIKSAKFFITRVVGNASLTFEEMHTALCLVEAVLNSRPIAPLSSDPNDLAYLSPGHFLIWSPLNSFPEDDVSDINVNRLSRWQLVEQMRQHFWSRWSNEYIISFLERRKWTQNKGLQLESGQLVLIKQGLPPLQWLTGRVQEVHRGSDGRARSALVKTDQRTYSSRQAVQDEVIVSISLSIFGHQTYDLANCFIFTVPK